MSAPADGPLRILVVEDEPVNRALLRAVLGGRVPSSLGPTQLLEAGSLAEARRIMAEAGLALVILDVRLPDGNGLDLARELPPPGTPGRPVVLTMSASVLPSDRDAAAASGSDAFLGKPFNPRELIAVLERLIRRVDGGA